MGGRRTSSGLRRLRLDSSERWGGMHVESGVCCMCRSLWNIARLATVRLQRNEGQASCSSSWSFGVIQSARRTVRAMLAWMRSIAIMSITDTSPVKQSTQRACKCYVTEPQPAWQPAKLVLNKDSVPCKTCWEIVGWLKNGPALVCSPISFEMWCTKM